MPPAPLLSFIAELPISSDQVQILIYVIGGAVVVGAIGSIKGVLDIIRFFRGDPPADRRFASKDELNELRAEVEAVEERAKIAVAAHRSEVERREEETAKALNDIFVEIRSMARSMGRIEGQLQGRSAQN